MSSLSHRTFLVTGATSGIGQQVTQSLLQQQANVAFCGRSPQKMAQFVNALAPLPPSSYYATFDATDFDSIRDFVEKAITVLGTVEVLINCAGSNPLRGPLADLSPDSLESLIRLNTLSPFVFMQEVYHRTMKSRGQGMIINVLSTVCQFANQGIGAYTASKAGLDALTHVFRKEVRENGIKICAIYPGGVNTPFRDSERPQYLTADSVAKAILFMAAQPDHACVDELIIRPMVEKNYP